MSKTQPVTVIIHPANAAIVTVAATAQAVVVHVDVDVAGKHKGAV